METARKRRLIQEAERVNPIAPVHIWRTPPGAAVDMVIVAHLDAYMAMHQHAIKSLPNETGGFLTGRVSQDHRNGHWHLEIEQAVPVDPISQDPVQFSFTWRDVDRVRNDREANGHALIGWYHTHPDLDIFLSETDLERTHRILFNEPFQIALVYDPVRGRAGYFFWEGPQRIDATSAQWREFEIAVAVEPAPGANDVTAKVTPPIDEQATPVPPPPPAAPGTNETARNPIVPAATQAMPLVATAPAPRNLTPVLLGVIATLLIVLTVMVWVLLSRGGK